MSPPVDTAKELVSTPHHKNPHISAMYLKRFCYLHEKNNNRSRFSNLPRGLSPHLTVFAAFP